MASLKLRSLASLVAISSVSFVLGGCEVIASVDRSEIPSEDSGASGSGGQGGKAGASGKAGQAGASGQAGSAGASGQAGSSGKGGAGGTAGSGGAAGKAGAAGSAGKAGSAGQAGAGGEAGQGGAAGSGGEAGQGGAGGQQGGAGGEAGQAGAAGGGGAPMCPPTSFEPLTACDSPAPSPSAQCFCMDKGTATDCAGKWDACAADEGCSKAVYCFGQGCDLNTCAALAGAGLSKAVALQACQPMLQSPQCGGTGGAAGASGAGGEAGAAGAAGEAGAAGAAGEAGAAGAGGEAGAAGAAGEAGAAGSGGESGAAGAGGGAGAGGVSGAGGEAGAGGASGAGGAAGAAGSGGSAGGASFSLAFSGSNFGAFDGKRFALVVSRTDTQAAVASVIIPAVQGGSIELSFPGLLQAGVSYGVDYFADASGNDLCDASPADAVWHQDVTGFSADFTVSADGAAASNGNCSPIAQTPPGKDLVVTGAGFDPHTGQKMAFALVDTTANKVVAKAVIPSLVGNSFAFTWKGALTSGDAYAFDYYADVSGNGVCDAPPTDHVWTQSIAAVTQNVTLPITHDTNWTDVCSAF